MGPPVATFRSDAPKFTSIGSGENLKLYSIVRVAWVVEDVGDVAEPNFVVDENETEITRARIRRRASFWRARTMAGPRARYRLRALSGRCAEIGDRRFHYGITRRAGGSVCACVNRPSSAVFFACVRSIIFLKAIKPGLVVSARQDPDFFRKLSGQQSPSYLWIGCSDSRVPANEIVGLLPGELFVHRNIANLVVHTDLNCLSVMQFAVDLLKVQHIIVCGHYGCSGVRAAFRRDRLGLSDNWLRHLQDVHQKHAGHLARLTDETAAANRLCELNVIEQVANVCQTTIVRDAWERGQKLIVHGWIYGLHGRTSPRSQRDRLRRG